MRSFSDRRHTYFRDSFTLVALKFSSTLGVFESVGVVYVLLGEVLIRVCCAAQLTDLSRKIL